MASYSPRKSIMFGVIDTAETISAVSMTPLKPILATFEAIISVNAMPYAKWV
jgi:hypothetical protein